jgi:hypothetical protein
MPDAIHTSDLGAGLGAEMCCIEADVAETLDDDGLVLEARLSATSTAVRVRIALFKEIRGTNKGASTRFGQSKEHAHHENESIIPKDMMGMLKNQAT